MRTLLAWLAALLGIAAAALLIFRTPDTDPAGMRAKYGAPPSRFVDVGDGLIVHIRDTGPRGAPVLMLIHGANASLHTWDQWSALLQRRYRVVRFDLPGHGLTGPSPAADYSPSAYSALVERVRAKLGIDRMALAGSSMGGGVAWHYALAHPKRVSALVLIDSAGAPPPPETDRPLAFRIVGIPVLRDLALVVTPRSLIENGLRGAFHDPQQINDVMIDRSWELLRYPGNRRAMLDRFAQPADVANPADLRALRMPVLILWGADDRNIPVSSGEWLHAHMPGSRLLVYPDIGHVMMEEAPDASAEAVDRFVRAVTTDLTVDRPANEGTR